MKNYKYDKHQEVEDSTKGKAALSPRVYKGDVYTQAWIDSRKLATLSIWLDEAGWRTRYLGEVVKFTLDMVLEHLVESGNVKMIEFTEEARDILEAKYKTNLNPGGRGKRNVLHNMVLDDKRKSGQVGGYNPESRFSYKPVESVQPKDDEQSSFNNKTKFSGSTVSKEMLEEAVRIYNEKEDEDIKKVAEEEKEKILANADIDENGVITPRGEPRGPVYQEDMDAYNKREEGRKRIEEIEKRNKVIEKREEKLNEELCLIKEKEYEDELIRGREGNSDGLKEEGSDVSEDSL